MIDLTQIVKKEETKRDNYNFDTVPENAYTEDIKDEIEKELDTMNSKSEPEVDTFDYTTDQPHILFSKKDLLQVISQVSTVLDTGSKRAVSRGITLKVISNDTVGVIMPNESYYFKSQITCTESTLEIGTTIFIEYAFIQKMVRFLPPKILIYSKVDQITKYYIKLTTDDLELLNTQLIESDAKRLENEYTIVGEPLCEISLTELSHSLTSLYGILNFESDSPRRVLSSYDGKITFKSPLVFASSDSTLLDIQLRKNEIIYLIRAAQLASDAKILKVYNTNSELTRYVFEYDNTQLMTNFAKPNEDAKIRDLLTKVPDLTVIDYGKLKYQLDYANSITYAMGTITLCNTDGVLSGMIKLSNGSEAPFAVPTISNVTIPANEKIRVNTKTLLSSLNALDSSQETRIGYSNGILYLSNNDITLMLITV